MIQLGGNSIILNTETLEQEEAYAQRNMKLMKYVSYGCT